MLNREDRLRQDALDREMRAAEALERERDRAAAQALEQTRLAAIQLQSASASRQTSRASTRDNSPMGRQPRREERPAKTPRPRGGDQADPEDLEGRLARLQEGCLAPGQGATSSSTPAAPCRTASQLGPRAPLRSIQHWPAATPAPHYDPLPQRPPGSAIPFFRDDSRSQYHDMRMCLEFLLGAAKAKENK